MYQKGHTSHSRDASNIKVSLFQLLHSLKQSQKNSAFKERQIIYCSQLQNMFLNTRFKTQSHNLTVVVSAQNLKSKLYILTEIAVGVWSFLRTNIQCLTKGCGGTKTCKIQE